MCLCHCVEKRNEKKKNSHWTNKNFGIDWDCVFTPLKKYDLFRDKKKKILKHFIFSIKPQDSNLMYNLKCERWRILCIGLNVS